MHCIVKFKLFSGNFNLKKLNNESFYWMHSVAFKKHVFSVKPLKAIFFFAFFVWQRCICILIRKTQWLTNFVCSSNKQLYFPNGFQWNWSILNGRLMNRKWNKTRRIEEKNDLPLVVVYWQPIWHWKNAVAACSLPLVEICSYCWHESIKFKTIKQINFQREKKKQNSQEKEQQQ